MILGLKIFTIYKTPTIKQPPVNKFSGVAIKHRANKYGGKTCESYVGIDSGSGK